MAITDINITTSTPNLQEVTDIGNDTTNNIRLSDSAIVLDNLAALKKGFIDNGQEGGIARECAVGYQDEWGAGIQYYINQAGRIVYANSINGSNPDATYDVDKGYIVGSYYKNLNNNRSYKCIDNTAGAAQWIQVTDQFQSDWNQNDNAASDYIKNKPTIPTVTTYGLFAQTANSPTLTASTAEATLIDGGVGTLSVPANGFTVGDSFQVSMGGVMSAKNNDTITIRLKTGSVVLASSGALTLPVINNQVWYLTAQFTIRAIGAAGVASIVSVAQFHILKAASGTQEGFAWNVINNTTFDTTISNTLNITGQFSSNSALNSIYSDIFILNKIY